ncbi:MAG: hypothetical protein AAFV53_41190, partial [Myxococcota bacterium]
MLPLLPLFCMFSSAALADWPVADDWIPLTAEGERLTDPVFDVLGPERTDILGDDTLAAGAWYIDGDALYLRMRLNGDPCTERNTDSECTRTSTDAWGVLMSVDGDDRDYEAALVLIEAGNRIALVDNVSGAGWEQPWRRDVDTWDPFPAFSTYARVQNAATAIEGVGDWLLDLQVPLSELEMVIGTDYTDTLRVALVTDREDGGDPGGEDQAFNTDLAGGDSLAGALSDALGVDEDGDGLNVGEEDELGTAPDDADTDDDGLDDLEERVLGSNPRLCDSDG